MRLRAIRAAAATVLVAAALGSPLLNPAPAAAAACGGATGVTVVVEYNGLGGGADLDCVAEGGGDTASSLFPAAGHPLTYAQRQPGYVCRVDGVPTSDPCVNTSPASAYWALYWTDGTSGTWNYSTLGVGSLRVPDGGSVAFVWDDQAGDVRPTTAAPVRPAATSSPTPTTRPTRTPGGGGGSGPGATRPSASAPAGSSSSSPSGSASPAGDSSDGADPGPTPTSSGSASASSATSASASTSPSPSAASAAPAATGTGAAEDGLPGWVAALAVAALGIAAGAVVFSRRLRSGS